MALRKLEKSWKTTCSSWSRNPAELNELYGELLIKVNVLFFRDPEMFQALQTKVLPEIVRRPGAGLAASCVGAGLCHGGGGILHRDRAVGVSGGEKAGTRRSRYSPRTSADEIN